MNHSFGDSLAIIILKIICFRINYSISMFFLIKIDLFTKHSMIYSPTTTTLNAVLQRIVSGISMIGKETESI